jgi:hypothetical protein
VPVSNHTNSLHGTKVQSSVRNIGQWESDGSQSDVAATARVSLLVFDFSEVEVVEVEVVEVEVEVEWVKVASHSTSDSPTAARRLMYSSIEADDDDEEEEEEEKEEEGAEKRGEAGEEEKKGMADRTPDAACTLHNDCNRACD